MFGSSRTSQAPPFTRREFLFTAAAAPFGMRALAQTSAAVPRWVLLGTDKGKGIYRAHWNAATGEIGLPELAFATDRPDFFAMHPKLPVLYTVNSVSGTQAGVSAFRVNAETAELTLINRLQTHGDGPCSVSVDATGQSAFAANYAGGSLTAYRLGPGGELAQTVGVFRYNQAAHGPVADRQDAAHLHCTTISPGNDFVVVCDLGDDVILLFPIAPDRNSFVGQPQRIAARPGSGPRHVAFHPNGRWLYCIHELDCTVDLYDWSVHRGVAAMTLRDGSAVSTLAAGASTQGNTACEVIVSDDGRYLYVCTRGENSLVVYTIDAETGLLQRQQELSCGGAVPRIIAFDPSRRWLVSANQGSSTLTVFPHNRANGRLAPKPRKFLADSPMFVQWI